MYVKSTLDKFRASNLHSNQLHNNKGGKKNNLFLIVKVVRHGPSEKNMLKDVYQRLVCMLAIWTSSWVSPSTATKNITNMNCIFAYQ